jgi:hypothetical protein
MPSGAPFARACPVLILTVTAIFWDTVAMRYNKRRAPYPGACHPVEEMATKHRGGAPGEKQWAPVGA